MRKSLLISISALLVCILALPNLIAGLARGDFKGWPTWVYVVGILGLSAVAIYGFGQALFRRAKARNMASLNTSKHA